MRFLFTTAVMCDCEDAAGAETLRQEMESAIYAETMRGFDAKMDAENATTEEREEARLEVLTRVMFLGTAACEVPERVLLEAE